MNAPHARIVGSKRVPPQPRVELDRYLGSWASDVPSRSAIAHTVSAIAATVKDIAALVGRGPLAEGLHAVVGGNADGDPQQALDLLAHDMFVDALRHTPVAVLASEESEDVLPLTEGAPLAVAIDPLDGSSNIDTNVSIGSIFAILPAPARGCEDAFLRPGREQCAAGFVVYGPQTTLVLTVGEGSHVFTLDRERSVFVLTRRNVQIPIGRFEYAINASNYRHWEEPVRAYIDDCISGTDGPRESEFNMRWIASLVAEAFRIFARGGIFLYPRDQRPGYQNGRLRLIYEANPIAFVTEQAGGAATNGETRILDIAPRRLHQRVPLVFGALDKVERVRRYHTDPPSIGERSPLFGSRGLFRV